VRPGYWWLGLGAIVAALATVSNDWKGVVAFCVASVLIPERDLWGRNGDD
jgi:hypothetical protein